MRKVLRSTTAESRQQALVAHAENLRGCRRCPKMLRPPVVGFPVTSRTLLIGQAPGRHEPVLGRPFAWTAGKTLFAWFAEHCGVAEEQFRRTVYMAAVCRCFPGGAPGGGDRVPDRTEVANCSAWLRAEFALLRPELVIPVGKLAIAQFLPPVMLTEMIGRIFPGSYGGHVFEIIPLPHPSGASPWPRIEPGRTLLRRALELIRRHPAFPRGGTHSAN
jgi:uracil-DNA glycosylase